VVDVDGALAEAALLGKEPCLDQGTQQVRDRPSVEPLSRQVVLAALAHAAPAEHDGEQASSVGRQERLRVGSVVGRNGSLDVSVARQSGGSPRSYRGPAVRSRARVHRWRISRLTRLDRVLDVRACVCWRGRRVWRPLRHIGIE
jgi:hypothetical protein